MESQAFDRVIKTVYVPFLKELGFRMGRLHFSGRCYLAEFDSPRFTVSVTFEPGDDYLSVRVITNEKNSLSDFDDPSTTPHLSDLNRQFMAAVTSHELEENKEYFRRFEPIDKNDELLLKEAKALRLVLPKYLHAKR